MINVVHPAYHCAPNGGHGSFCPAPKFRFNCDRVLATVEEGLECQSQLGNRLWSSYIRQGT